MAKFSLPSLKAIKLPFGKGGSSLHDPIEDEYEEEDTDGFDYNAPSKFQKMLPWLLVVGGYLVTVGGVAGTYLYLDSNAERFEQELIDQRPTNVVEQIKIAETHTIKEPTPPIKEDTVKEDTPKDAATKKTEQDAHGEATADADKNAKAKTGDENPAAEQPSPDASADEQLSVSLLPHPDMGLVQETNEGLLPIVGNDGRQAWQVYSRPFNSFETKPKIAIVIMDLGVSAKMTEEALKLPGQVTLSFAPYAPKLSDWVDKSRAAGHEVMLSLPMEPTDFPKSDPGPYALYSSLDVLQNTKKLDWILSRTTGYIGLIGYQGSKFLTSDSNVRNLAAQFKKRGLLYMDSFYSPVNAAPKMMRQNEVPYLRMTLDLDSPPGRINVSRKLKELEAAAIANGSAIAVARPYKTTIKRIKIWAEELAEKKKVALVPVSSIAIEGLQK